VSRLSVETMLVGELLERFKNLGICASRASVTAALAEVGLELELSGWAPSSVVGWGSRRFATMEEG
jgi:hypothetical protein